MDNEITFSLCRGTNVSGGVLPLFLIGLETRAINSSGASVWGLRGATYCKRNYRNKFTHACACKRHVLDYVCQTSLIRGTAKQNYQSTCYASRTRHFGLALF